MNSQVSAQEKLDKQHQNTAVSAVTHAAEPQAEAHTLTPKETISTYFTIAAAAFGLISDGCK
jgi:hypothetical protein